MCKSKSFCIMLTVNLLLLGLGIALTAVAGLVKTHRTALVNNAHISSADVDEVMPASDVNVALAGGCLLLFVGLVGIVGACKAEGAFGKVLLCVYSLFMLVVIVLEIAAFGLIVVITNRLDDFSSDVSSGNQEKLEKANAKIMGFVNDTRCACCEASWTTGTCGPKAGDQAGSDACKLLKDIVSEANCANNKAFTKPVVDWINARLKAVSIFSLVVAIIQLCTLCAACCLMCRKKKSQDDYQPAGPGSYQNPQPIGSGAAKGQQVVYA